MFSKNDWLSKLYFHYSFMSENKLILDRSLLSKASSQDIKVCGSPSASSSLTERRLWIHQSSACFMGTSAAFIELPLKYPLCPLFWAPCLGSYVGRSYVSRELEKMDATDAISRQRWMWIPDPTTPIFLPLPMHCHKYPLALAVVCTYSSC